MSKAKYWQDARQADVHGYDPVQKEIGDLSENLQRELRQLRLSLEERESLYRLMEEEREWAEELELLSAEGQPELIKPDVSFH